MKLIIDLPKEKYEWIKTHNLNIDNNSIVEAVANGIPYNPTGNLISREALKEAFEDCTGECACCVHNTNHFKYCGLIDDAPAVL